MKYILFAMAATPLGASLYWLFTPGAPVLVLPTIAVGVVGFGGVWWLETEAVRRSERERRAASPQEPRAAA